MANKLMTAEGRCGIHQGRHGDRDWWLGPRRKPMALVRELLRSPVKDLTVVAYGGADGACCVRQARSRS